MRWLVLGLISLAWALGTANTAAAEKSPPDTIGAVEMSFAPVVKRVLPAMVAVFASHAEQVGSSAFSDPFFQKFFGDAGGQPSQKITRTAGTGVIIDSSGLIVTALNVVADADTVRVRLADGREFTTDVVLKDRRSELAVLRISGAGSNLPTIPFADSDTVEVGDLVLSIGNPFSVGLSVSFGLVSAFTSVPDDPARNTYFVQTDAAINPGDSGGALVDVKGRLVGIDRMIVTPSGKSFGVGFAIPSNLVQAVVGAVATGQARKPPWLGATVQDVTPAIADAMKLASSGGVLVTDVVLGGPAATTHLQNNDVIVSIDDNPVKNVSVLDYRLDVRGVGGTATLGIIRDGKQYQTTIKLEVAPETVPRDETTISGDLPLTGATVLNLSPAVADELGFTGKPNGVIVSSVADNTPASIAHLQRGDVIVKLNDVSINTTHQLARVAGQKAHTWDLIIDRGGKQLRVQVRS